MAANARKIPINLFSSYEIECMKAELSFDFVYKFIFIFNLIRFIFSRNMLLPIFAIDRNERQQSINKIFQNNFNGLGTSQRNTKCVLCFLNMFHKKYWSLNEVINLVSVRFQDHGRECMNQKTKRNTLIISDRLMAFFFFWKIK